MSNFNEETVSEITEIFNLYDSRGDGKIFANQLGDVLRALGENPTEAEIKKCGYSNTPDARIPLVVFMPIAQTMSKNREKHSAEDFIDGFRLFDKECNGYISSAELRYILTNLGDRLSDEECDQLLSGMEDSQGNINYEEFIKYVMSG